LPERKHEGLSKNQTCKLAFPAVQVKYFPPAPSEEKEKKLNHREHGGHGERQRKDYFERIY
jgi:hypothetical protein